MSVITINENSFDPVGPSASRLRAVDASNSDYILIQTQASLSREQNAELTNLGVDVQRYVSPNTYLCGYKSSDLDAVRSLPFITWADVYHQEFKVAPDLKPVSSIFTSSVLSPPPAADAHSRSHTVDVVFHDDIDPNSDEIKSKIANAAHVALDSLGIGRRKVRITVSERYMHNIAAIDEVRVIEKVHPAQFYNNVARVILNANVVINGTGYKGDGEIVTVADSGLDIGKVSGVHPAFAGRIANLYNLDQTPVHPLPSDTNGHGTHVSGSVLGDGNSPSMGGNIQGTAPSAKLVMQSIGEYLRGVPVDLYYLFKPPYENDNSRVHTNSWGSASLSYTTSSEEIDEFVWDHPDMVILFAAGNYVRDKDPQDGVIDLGTIGDEAAAKNCITVGASETNRPRVPDPKYYTYGDLGFPLNPISKDPMTDNPQGMAAFSSRGPTSDGRFKPDVVAPGTSILSARSRLAPDHVDFGTSSDKDWMFDSGTSMATPLVAGCAAVIRETLVKNGFPKPAAALIKAFLINGAVDLLGQYTPSEAGPSPNNNSGWGLVNLANSVMIPGPNANGGFGGGGPLNEDESEGFEIDIPGEPRSQNSPDGVHPMGLTPTLKITVVWSDRPGNALQNDLDLIVIASDGEERQGNSETSSGYDRVNNVEQVKWANIPPGRVKWIVRAHKIPMPAYPQPYYYVWRLSWS